MPAIRACLCLPLISASAIRLEAATGTDVVVYSGREFSPELVGLSDWPEGALEIANDPLRTWGHLVWSSGTANDLLQFVMGIRDGADVQHHVDSMLGVKSLKRQIILVPGHLPLLPGYAAPPEDNGLFGVIFQIGSQRAINEWHDRLPEVCPGLRRFGNRELQRPPEARRPTLVISVSHPLVKLEELRILAIIDVKADIDPTFRAEDRNGELIERVEGFVAQHRARQTRLETGCERATSINYRR